MGISIYKSLLESYEYDSLKNYFTENLTNFQKISDIYINDTDEDERSDVLGKMLQPLNNIIKKFKELGFTYEPDSMNDVNEDSFTTILHRYSDLIDTFLQSFDRTLFESFNVQTQSIFTLIDLHRTQYIKEDEVLIDNLD